MYAAERLKLSIGLESIVDLMYFQVREVHSMRSDQAFHR